MWLIRLVRRPALDPLNRTVKFWRITWQTKFQPQTNSPLSHRRARERAHTHTQSHSWHHQRITYLLHWLFLCAVILSYFLCQFSFHKTSFQGPFLFLVLFLTHVGDPAMRNCKTLAMQLTDVLLVLEAFREQSNLECEHHQWCGIQQRDRDRQTDRQWERKKRDNGGDRGKVNKS